MRQTDMIASIVEHALDVQLKGPIQASVRAAYLWGSSVRSDFSSTSSDIDCIIVLKSRIYLADFGAMQAKIRDHYPDFKRFNARTICVEDLNNTVNGSRLTQLIHPKILASDLPNWRLVWGEGLQPGDLNISHPSLEFLLALRLNSLRRRLNTHFRDPMEEPVKYILKEAGFICHLLHQLRIGEHPFSYEALRKYADCLTAHVAQAVVTLRDAGWREGDCRRALRLVLAFFRNCQVVSVSLLDANSRGVFQGGMLDLTERVI